MPPDPVRGPDPAASARTLCRTARSAGLRLAGNELRQDRQQTLPAGTGRRNEMSRRPAARLAAYSLAIALAGGLATSAAAQHHLAAYDPPPTAPAPTAPP